MAAFPISIRVSVTKRSQPRRGKKDSLSLSLSLSPGEQTRKPAPLAASAVNNGQRDYAGIRRGCREGSRGRRAVNSRYLNSSPQRDKLHFAKRESQRERERERERERFNIEYHVAGI
jgi:hypothetical protein